MGHSLSVTERHGSSLSQEEEFLPDLGTAQERLSRRRLKTHDVVPLRAPVLLLLQPLHDDLTRALCNSNDGALALIAAQHSDDYKHGFVVPRTHTCKP